VERCLVEQKLGGLWTLARNSSKKRFQYISPALLQYLFPVKNYWLIISFILILKNAYQDRVIRISNSIKNGIIPFATGTGWLPGRKGLGLVL
jgi:hypothetical protein